MTGFFEREPGNKSMMRLLAFLSHTLGSVMVVWGLVLITIIVSRIVNGAENSAILIQLIGSLILVVSGGAGLAAGGEVLKVVQQRSEVREKRVVSNGQGGMTTHETMDVESTDSVDSSRSGGGGL
jgi:hypothetical protein